MRAAFRQKFVPAGRPGRRFRQRYHQHRQSRQRRGVGAMLVRVVLAALCTIIGFILVFIPGPAVLFFFIAGALLATDWLPVARLLDWAEVQVRRVVTRLARVWKRLSPGARVAVVVAGAVLGLAGSVGFLRLMT